MHLRNEEIAALKGSEQKPLRIWRFDEPAFSEPKRKYTAAELVYTVIRKVQLTPYEVMQGYGRGTWEALLPAWPEDKVTVWLVVIINGDWTDRPRLLSPAGRGTGDYTEQSAMAMEGEPEAITADEANEYAQQAWVERTDLIQAYSDFADKNIADRLLDPGVRREERKKLRYVQWHRRKKN